MLVSFDNLTAVQFIIFVWRVISEAFSLTWAKRGPSRGASIGLGRAGVQCGAWDAAWCTRPATASAQAGSVWELLCAASRRRLITNHFLPGAGARGRRKSGVPILGDAQPDRAHLRLLGTFQDAQFARAGAQLWRLFIWKWNLKINL